MDVTLTLPVGDNPPKARLLYGEHVLDTLRGLPSESVHCCVTSPPYWHLRCYGTPLVKWGDGWIGELGQEPTPRMFVTHLVEVFREVRRVLRPDGILWVNMGDSYIGSGKAGANPAYHLRHTTDPEDVGKYESPTPIPPGFKRKDLAGIPWRMAIALQDDGWWLRNDIIWFKSNSLPHPVRDRLKTSHEHVFLFAKGTWEGPERVPMTQENAAWLAALVDGEGTITIGRNKRHNSTNRDVFTVILSVANVHRGLLEKIVKVTGMGRVRETKTGTNFPILRWAISSRKATSVLWAILDHLIVKRDQAFVALSCQEELRYQGGSISRREQTPAEYAYKEKCWEIIKALNQRQDVGDLSWVKQSKPGKWSGGTYYFDLEAIRVPFTYGDYDEEGNFTPAQQWFEEGKGDRKMDLIEGHLGTYAGPPRRLGRGLFNPGGKNPGDVWQFPPANMTAAHFAVMPESIAERCIRAGTSERGCCPTCGAPWKRVLQKHATGRVRNDIGGLGAIHRRESQGLKKVNRAGFQEGVVYNTVGWEPACSCLPREPVRCTVLDPFSGSGTTGKVALAEGRDYLGIDFQEKYLSIAERRVINLDPLDRDADLEAPPPEGSIEDLFGE